MSNTTILDFEREVNFIQELISKSNGKEKELLITEVQVLQKHIKELKSSAFNSNNMEMLHG